MAREFDGASYLMGSHTLGLTDYPFSVFAWFWASARPPYGNVIWSISSATSNSQAHYLWVFTNAVGAGTVNGGSSRLAQTAVGWSTSSWQSVCGVWRAGDQGDVYVNGGNKVTATTNVSWPSLDRTAIGCLCRSTIGYHLAARVALVAVWSADLTDDEVAALHDRYHPRLIKPTSLVACWDLGGFAGQNDRDYFGQYDLTAYNNPTWTDHLPVIHPCGPHVAVPPASFQAAWADGINSSIGFGVA